jgi:hypothetical protein
VQSCGLVVGTPAPSFRVERSLSSDSHTHNCGTGTRAENYTQAFGAPDSCPRDACVSRCEVPASYVYRPRQGRFQDSSDVPTLLISAVDTNRAREALQQHYAPRILSASTRDLRAEVLRVGPPAIGACLRCYNMPMPIIADDTLRTHALSSGAPTIEALASELGLDREAVEQWLNRGDCS